MIPRLLAITPPSGPVAATALEVANELGVPLAVLLREPGADPAALLRPGARVAALLRAARARQVPVLCACAPPDAPGFAAQAQDAGLVGLHLRSDPTDEALEHVRDAWPQAVLSASVHGAPRDVKADLLVFAPVFSPGTPAGFAKPPAGVEPLAAWSARHPRVFALGGVTRHTAGACAKAGAYGLAGISTFLGSADALADTLRTLAGALTSAPDVPPRSRR